MNSLTTAQMNMVALAVQTDPNWPTANLINFNLWNAWRAAGSPPYVPSVAAAPQPVVTEVTSQTAALTAEMEILSIVRAIAAKVGA